MGNTASARSERRLLRDSFEYLYIRQAVEEISNSLSEEQQAELQRLTSQLRPVLPSENQQKVIVIIAILAGLAASGAAYGISGYVSRFLEELVQDLYGQQEYQLETALEVTSRILGAFPPVIFITSTTASFFSFLFQAPGLLRNPFTWALLTPSLLQSAVASQATSYTINALPQNPRVLGTLGAFTAFTTNTPVSFFNLSTMSQWFYHRFSSNDLSSLISLEFLLSDTLRALTKESDTPSFREKALKLFLELKHIEKNTPPKTQVLLKLWRICEFWTIYNYGFADRAKQAVSQQSNQETRSNLLKLAAGITASFVAFTNLKAGIEAGGENLYWGLLIGLCNFIPQVSIQSKALYYFLSRMVSNNNEPVSKKALASLGLLCTIYITKRGALAWEYPILDVLALQITQTIFSAISAAGYGVQTLFKELIDAYNLSLPFVRHSSTLRELTQNTSETQQIYPELIRHALKQQVNSLLHLVISQPLTLTNHLMEQLLRLLEPVEVEAPALLNDEIQRETPAQTIAGAGAGAEIEEDTASEPGSPVAPPPALLQKNIESSLSQSEAPISSHEPTRNRSRSATPNRPPQKTRERATTASYGLGLHKRPETFSHDPRQVERKLPSTALEMPAMRRHSHADAHQGALQRRQPDSEPHRVFEIARNSENSRLRNRRQRWGSWWCCERPRQLLLSLFRAASPSENGSESERLGLTDHSASASPRF